MNDPIRFIRAVEGTSVDGPGLRTSLYFAGCAHRCPGCHNEHTWDFAAGHDETCDSIMDIVRRNDFNVTFSGGDPLYQAKALLPLACAIKTEGKTIWCYTGFIFEELARCGIDGVPELLGLIDVLVDGPFVAALKDESLRFRGSSNQRLIDVPSTLAQGRVVLWGAD